MTKKIIQIVLFALGAGSIIYGVSHFFWLERIEEASNEPGLGGLAVWAIAWVLTFLGFLLIGIGILISRRE
ncbi:hypothetical protein GTQ34_16150 [Muricauda sp. JGD-17]|uniref:Uncharacterized protein n=1 Tax=Flagellimonas ochracea TaxID=2696472 RepID=A0A964WZ54_9FLAO|nr:hypothetical protein [Allomuricauda ochracea]NAY93444.1 hypothetical protein [Allomuricauda ochracea]